MFDMKVLLIVTIVVLLGDSTFGCSRLCNGYGNCSGNNVNVEARFALFTRSLSRNKIEVAVEKEDGLVIKKRSDQRLLDKFDDEDASKGDKAEAFEQLTFTVCNKDGTDGLTWDEIKDCKGKYCGNQKLVERKICPKKSDFNAFDNLLSSTRFNLYV